MYILRTVLFIVITVGALLFVTYSFLGWSVFDIAILLLVGALFIAFSIIGYKKMYGDE
jgi:hypothetical protein